MKELLTNRSVWDRIEGKNVKELLMVAMNLQGTNFSAEIFPMEEQKQEGCDYKVIARRSSYRGVHR